MSDLKYVTIIVISACVTILWSAPRISAEPTTAKYTYNSSDLSYLSNGIQFPAPAALSADIQGASYVTGDDTGSKIPEMVWFRGLYDQHQWGQRLENVSDVKCRADMVLYIEKLLNGTSWATKMYDASGHYAGQFLFGNDYWLGSHTSCEELTNTKTNSEVPPFPVYFYVAKVRINFNNNLTPVTRQVNIGQCLPKACSAADVRFLLVQERTQGASLNIVDVRPVPGPYSLLSDIKVHIVGGVGLATVAIIVIASFVEVITKQRKNKVYHKDADAENNNNNNNNNHCTEDKKGSKEMVIKPDNCQKKKHNNTLLSLLLAFSAVQNGKKILNTDFANESIRCIHGLRFFSIAWIIMVHTYLEVFSVADNKTVRTLTERGFMYQTISNASFSVDTFFFISGLLVTLTFLRTDSKKQKTTKPDYSFRIFKSDTLKFLMMIFYRFFRLTPAYMFVLGINEIILRYLHNSSVFSPAIIDHLTCDSYWWRNALYINNFFPQAEFCMLWSWYMANDTQFFVIATLLLIIAVRGQSHVKFVAVSMGALMVTSWITTFIIAMKYEFVARVEEPFALFDQLYDKPWLRIGPYLIGMAIGYFLFKVNCKVIIPHAVVIVGWIVSMLCLGSLVYGLGRQGLVIPSSAFYAALGHTAWGLSLAWITIACVSGYGGPFNAFFSCKLFLPLSRLTYCAYLVHPVLMCLTSFILDGPLHLHNALAIVIFFGNVVMSFLCAFAISLAFEAPIVNLLKILL